MFILERVVCFREMFVLNRGAEKCLHYRGVCFRERERDVFIRLHREVVCIERYLCLRYIISIRKKCLYLTVEKYLYSY